MSISAPMYEEWLRTIQSNALTSIKIQKSPDFRYWPEVDDYTMSAGFAMTSKGRIWITWFGGGDNDTAVMLLAKSDDGGKTFSKPQFVLDAGWLPHGIHIGTLVGNLWCDPFGRLWLFYMQSIGYFDGRGGTWAARCDNPDDDEPQWNPPARIWHGCALNKPTLLADGSWMLPITLWGRDKIGTEIALRNLWLRDSTLFPELDEERRTWIFVSNDNGKTWTRRGSSLNLSGRTFDEPMIAECNDGSLFMLQRAIGGITQCISCDGGYTWTIPEPFPLPAPTARFFLTRLASGKFLLVKNHNPAESEKRSHMTAFLSDDGGRTWYGGLLLDEREGISYPDGFQTPDGRIFIQYDRDRTGGEILMAVFTEEDVAAGRLLSAHPILRHPIIQSYTKLTEYSHA